MQIISLVGGNTQELGEHSENMFVASESEKLAINRINLQSSLTHLK